MENMCPAHSSQLDGKSAPSPHRPPKKEEARGPKGMLTSPGRVTACDALVIVVPF